MRYLCLVCFDSTLPDTLPPQEWAQLVKDSADYDRELFAASLGHDAVLPRVVGPGDAMGRTVAHDGVPAGILVAAGAGDNAAAGLGLGAREGDVVVSIGTSGTVFAVTDKPVADESGTVAGFADASGAFLPLVATLNAARVLDRTAALLGVDHAGLGELALAAEPGSAWRSVTAS